MIRGSSMWSRLGRLLHLSLRIRLALWMAVLLGGGLFLLALFINVGTTLTIPNQLAPVQSFLIESCTNVKPFSGSQSRTFKASVVHACVYPTPAPQTHTVVVAPQPVNVIQHLRVSSLLGIACILLLGTAGAYVLAGLALRPIRAISRAAGQVDTEKLDYRLPTMEHLHELNELGAAFNGMLDRLQRGFERERRFAAAASHELRTPLTIIRTNVEVVDNNTQASVADYQLMTARVRRSLTRLDQLVHDLLLFSSQTADYPQALDEVAPSQVVEDVVAELQPLAAQQEVTLGATYQGDATVRCEQTHLRRVVSNLVENAIRYNRPGGRVEVETEVREGTSSITVSDTGLGMDAEELAHIFEPFWRSAEARSRPGGGAGLGLSLVSDIVERYKGKVSVESVPGEGTRVTVELPLM